MRTSVTRRIFPQIQWRRTFSNARAPRTPATVYPTVAIRDLLDLLQEAAHAAFSDCLTGSARRPRALLFWGVAAGGKFVHVVPVTLRHELDALLEHSPFMTILSTA